MSTEIELLVKLQYIDQNIDSLEYKKFKIPEEIELLKNEMTRAEKALKDAENNYTEYQKSIKKKEGEIEDEKEKSKKNRLKQNEVKTNDEYRALLKEIEFINTRIYSIEEELLKMYDMVDHYKQEIASAKKELEKEKKICEEQIAAKNNELKEIESEAAFNREERTKLAADINPANYKVYEKLLYYKDKIAISKIDKKGVCQHCSVLIPPQTVNEVIADEKILYCPNCQRILYYSEEE